MESSGKRSTRRADAFAAGKVEPLDVNRVQARAFADAYAFLDICLKLPSSGLAAMLAQGQVAASVADMAADLAGLAPEHLAEAACACFEGAQEPTPASLSSLREAYTILFTNPLGTKMHNHEAQFLYYRDDPYADVGLSPRMFVNPSALSVERIVKKAGLERNPASNESADHIATEMELLSRLFDEKARMLEEGAPVGQNASDEAALDAVIREFAHYHCAKWHEGFFTQLAKCGVHGFFDGVGSLGLFVTRALESI